MELPFSQLIQGMHEHDACSFKPTYYSKVADAHPPIPLFKCRGLKSINDTCSEAAASMPLAACIGDAVAPLDDTCMASYGTMFGLSAAELAAIQAPYRKISDTCGALKTEVRGMQILFRMHELISHTFPCYVCQQYRTKYNRSTDAGRV